MEFGGYRPGCVAEIVGLHARYYARAWSFGLPFEAKVAAELGAFLGRMQAGEDLFLTAYDGDDLAGSITVDASGGGSAGAHLRWYIVSDRARGSGLGGLLMDRAMRFCDERGLPVWLTTFAGLDAARRLYERHGFVLAGECADDQWSGGVREQRFERRARVPAA